MRNRLKKVGEGNKNIIFIDADDAEKVGKINNLRQKSQMSRFDTVFNKQAHARESNQSQGHRFGSTQNRHFSKVPTYADKVRIEEEEAVEKKSELCSDFKKYFPSIAEKEDWQNFKNDIDLTNSSDIDEVAISTNFNFGDRPNHWKKNSDYRSGAMGSEYNRQTQVLGNPNVTSGQPLVSQKSFREQIDSNRKYDEQLRIQQEELEKRRKESSFRIDSKANYGKRSETNLVKQKAFQNVNHNSERLYGDSTWNPVKEKAEKDRATISQRNEVEKNKNLQEVEKQRQQQIIQQKKEWKRLEEEKEREKQRKIREKKLDEENSKLRKQLLDQKGIRYEELEKSQKMDIKKDFDIGIRSESIKYRTDVSFLLKTILNTKYFEKIPSDTKSTPIPDFFSSPDHYFESFIPCFLEECSSMIKESLNQFGKRRYHDGEGLEVSLNYLQHESDHFCEYEITDFSGTADFIFRQNMAVLISNMDEPDVNKINLVDSNFCVIGILKEKKSGDTPNLITSTDYNKMLLSAIKNKDSRIRLFELTKLTSELREFLALKNIEFDPISKLIYQPKFIVSETTKKHDVEIYTALFKQLKAKFNEGQMKAIQNISLMKQGIKLLQGPPGTGKTHTLIGIVSALSFYMRQSESTYRKQILICTPSNYAIDEIILRLMSIGLYTDSNKNHHPRIVRLGVTDKIKDPEVLKVCIKGLVDKEIERRDRIKKIEKEARDAKAKPEALAASTRLAQMTDYELRQRSDELKAKIGFASATQGSLAKTDSLRIERDKIITEIIERKRAKIKQKDTKELIEEEILQNAEIICCTLNSSGSEKLDRYEHRFEAIIIDEAAQSTEPANMIPLRFRANKVILIGDPMQLPATTLGPNSIKTKYNRSLFEVCFNQSFPYRQRILNTGIRVEFLYTQYRMVPELRQFPSDEFYSGRLKDSEEMSKRNFPPDLNFLEQKNMIFLNVENSSQQKSGFSFYNQKEVTVCTTLINLFKAKIPGFNQKTMAVVSPYKEQVQHIRDSNHNLVQSNSLEVNTVDAFQGQEKDIIIFSCVRTNNSGIGFLQDIRRLNVAITRAKYALYIVGNAETLKVDKTWSNLLHHFNLLDKIYTLDNNQAFKHLVESFSSPQKPISGNLNGRLQLVRNPPEINLLAKRAFDKLHEQKADLDQSILSIADEQTHHYYDGVGEFETEDSQSQIKSLKKLKTQLNSFESNFNSITETPYLESAEKRKIAPGSMQRTQAKSPSNTLKSPGNKPTSGRSQEYLDSNPLSSMSLSNHQSPVERPKLNKPDLPLSHKAPNPSQHYGNSSHIKPGNRLSSLIGQKIQPPAPNHNLTKTQGGFSSLIHTPSTNNTAASTHKTEKSRNPLQDLLKSHQPKQVASLPIQNRNFKKSGLDLEEFAQNSNFYSHLGGKKQF